MVAEHDALRPVTPVAIAAHLLDEVAAGIGEDATPDAVAALDRARRLLGGMDDYLGRMTTGASADLAALDATTTAHGFGEDHEAEMLSGHVEGQLLRLLVAATGATRVLDVGMFTGYSALAMAEGLGPDGRVVACEVDQGVADVARAAFADAAAGERIEVRVGDAAATLEELADQGEVFDLAFVDADKPGYASYLALLLDRGLLRPGGLLVVDNTLLQGEPWAADQRSGNGEAIAAFNEVLAAEPRIEQVVVPLRDGVTLGRVVDDV